eukprot:gene30642-34790_t
MAQPASDTSEPLTLDLTGMTCAACAARIEKVLSRVPGVAHATVNLALESAEVEAVGAAPEQLVAAVERAGYGATLRSADPDRRQEQLRARDDERRREARSAMVLFLFSALLTSPFLVAMGDMSLNGHAHWFSPLLQASLATPVQIVAGWRFYVGAFKALRGGA